LLEVDEQGERAGRWWCCWRWRVMFWVRLVIVMDPGEVG
jgi:hypothetical protein